MVREIRLEERLESFLMAVLEMESGGPMPRKYRQPLEAEKRQEIDLPKPPEWNATLLAP